MALQVDESEADELRHTAREKDYCAGFNCFVKQGNKLRNVLNLQTQESQHMTGYTKDMDYFYAKMTNNHY